MIVDFCYRSVCVRRDLVRRQLDCAPCVDQPPVGVVDGLYTTAGESGPGQQHRGRPGEGFYVAARVAERSPDPLSGAVLATEVGERGYETGVAGDGGQIVRMSVLSGHVSLLMWMVARMLVHFADPFRARLRVRSYSRSTSRHGLHISSPRARWRLTAAMVPHGRSLRFGCS